MKTELIPAAVALAGGAAALAAISAHERAREHAMRRRRVRYQLTFPGGTSADQAVSALGGLSGARAGTEFVFEVSGSAGVITHAVAVPADAESGVCAGLAAAIPGLRLRRAGSCGGELATLVVRVFVPRRALLRSDDPLGAGRGLLVGLARLGEGEEVVVRWALRATVPPAPAAPASEAPDARELARALRNRAAEPGFGVSGLVVIRAGSIERARQIAEHVAAVLRSRRGRSLELRLSFRRGTRGLVSVPRVTRASGWLSVLELVPLLGWPLGDELIEGVRVGVSRQLRAGAELAREGRRRLWVMTPTVNGRWR